MNPRGTPANLKRGPGPGRPPGSRNRLPREVLALGRKLADTAPRTNKAFAEHILTDRDYLALALARVAAGTADHLERFIWEHALGRPPVSEEDGRDRPLVEVYLGGPCGRCGQVHAPPDPLGEDPPDVELLPPKPVKALPARRVEEPRTQGTGQAEAGPDLDVYRY